MQEGPPIKLTEKEKPKSDTISKHMHSNPNIYNLDINDELEYRSNENAKKTENEALSAADIEPHGSLSDMQI